MRSEKQEASAAALDHMFCYIFTSKTMHRGILHAQMPEIWPTPLHCCRFKFPATYTSPLPLHHRPGQDERASWTQHVKPGRGGEGKETALAAPWQQPVISLETKKEDLRLEGKPVILGKQIINTASCHGALGPQDPHPLQPTTLILPPRQKIYLPALFLSSDLPFPGSRKQRERQGLFSLTRWCEMEVMPGQMHTVCSAAPGLQPSCHREQHYQLLLALENAVFTVNYRNNCVL